MGTPAPISLLRRRRGTSATLGVGAGSAALLAVTVAPSADAAPRSGFSAWQPETAAYGVSTPVNISVKMDDGVMISTEVVFPTDPATGARGR
jgi:hypothetical protein